MSDLLTEDEVLEAAGQYNRFNDSLTQWAEKVCRAQAAKTRATCIQAIEALSDEHVANQLPGSIVAGGYALSLRGAPGVKAFFIAAVRAVGGSDGT